MPNDQARPTKCGLNLQTICQTGGPDEFSRAFIIALQEWAKEAEIPRPAAVNDSLHKHQFTAQTGATEVQTQELFKRVQIELDCSSMHSSGPSDTLGGMARFYYSKTKEAREAEK